MQHRSVSQSAAGSAHEVRYSAAAAAVPAASPSSRSSSGRSSVGIGLSNSPAVPKSVLSYIETPRDTATTGRLQDETVHSKEQSGANASSKPSSETADTSSHSRVVAHHDDTSRVSVTSHNSNLQSSVKTAVMHESARSAATSQSGNHDRPKTPRLAVYDIFFLLELGNNRVSYRD